MKGNHIGELEELVLLAVGALYKEGAYAVAILKVIKDSTDRKLDVTAVHSVLRRLERKGFVKSSMGGATQERGGRRKRFFNLTQAGRQALDDVMAVRMALYNKIPKLIFSQLSL
ncbi:helix-turn-helix transcriptional regulator [Fulvivirgaceae bacterium BMA10]|uniref:Helix-turn-helix transcriptional regulator n=1 Tax=Splendidivirga corallicola TaxID=3051826 RepID=A0ABT8KMK1_9BACT|nr:helix-turn-helix transcriptional regulator [Fulvivirgaceae bacterium BMA10]